MPQEISLKKFHSGNLIQANSKKRLIYAQDLSASSKK